MNTSLRVTATTSVVCGPFLAALACVYTYMLYGVSDAVLWSLCINYFFKVTSISLGNHRYFTPGHQGYTTSEKFEYVLGFVAATTAQGPIGEWALWHMPHHQFTEKEGDPHSPIEGYHGLTGRILGFFHAHFVWLFTYHTTRPNGAIQRLRKKRSVKFVDRYYFQILALGIAIPTLANGLWFGSWWGLLEGFLWSGLLSIFLLQQFTWSVNSLCHIVGTRPFDTGDNSRNLTHVFMAAGIVMLITGWQLDNHLLLALGIIVFINTMGEYWHNCHHLCEKSIRHGLYWYQPDFTWYLAWLLDKAHVISLYPRVTDEEIEALKEQLRRVALKKQFA